MSAPAEQDICIEQAIRNDIRQLAEQVAEIRAKLEAAEQAFAGFITGPGIGKMFKAIANGKG